MMTTEIVLFYNAIQMYRVRTALPEMLSFVIVLFFLSESDINLAPLDPRSFPAKFCERITTT